MAEKGRIQHVVKHKDGWAVKGQGALKATKVFKTQAEAAEYAKQIAKNQGTDARVHKRDGKFRK